MMQKKYLLSLMICILLNSFFTIAFAQNNNAAQKLFDKAIEAFDNKTYPEGVRLLLASVQKDSNFVDGYLALFQAYLDNKQKKKAVEVFEKAVSKDSMGCLPYFVKYANAYASLGDFNKAAIILQTIAPKLPAYLLHSYTQLKNICAFANEHPLDTIVKVINVGDSINTSAAEYFPSVTVQDSMLIFMRKNGINREDFFSSTMSTNGFSKATPFSDHLNWIPKKGAPSLSTDLQHMYFAAENTDVNFGRYDIYIVAKNEAGWTLPTNLGPAINSAWWESAPSISPDGEALYFCSDMPGGYGGIDIYVAYKNKKGGWNKAINLGPTINTAGDEQTPFIHADNNTLYFSSTGWPGFGGADLFVSHKKIDGLWSKPINLGNPINTNDNELSIAIASDGSNGYIASDRIDSRGNLDIYKINLPEYARANTTYYFNGFIKDAITSKGISGTIKLTDFQETNKLMFIDVDSTGKFVLALPYFDSLGIQVNSPSHEFTSLILSKPLLKKMNGSHYEFVLKPIQKEFSKNFNNVLFEKNTANLLNSSLVELNALYTYLQNTPAAHILIEGHTDNTGSPAANSLLSSKRAEAIAQFLLMKGIQKNSITTKGWGDTKPIGDNATEQGRALNRRTSFTITLF